MSDDPERHSIDFREARRVPVATVKAFHRLKGVELNRLKEAIDAELQARKVYPYKPGYPVVGYNATEEEATAVSTAPRTIAEPAPGDSQTGIDRAPDRYTAQGRETIDRMRDRCYEDAMTFFAEWDSVDPGVYGLEALADSMFVTHCRLTAMKYRDRHGLKEGVLPERDEKAAWFYEQMAAHVESGGEVPDPRSGRDNFTPYVREEWTE